MVSNKQNPKSQKDYSWVWIIIVIIAFIIYSKSSDSNSNVNGPRYPLDDQYREDLDIAKEYWEGKQEAEQLKFDPCLQDKLAGVSEEYQRCGNNNQLGSVLIPGNSSKQTVIRKSPESVKGCINVSSLNVRSGPGTHYSVLGYLYKDDCIILMERNVDSSWAKFDDGWVSSDYLDLVSSIDILPIAGAVPSSPSDESNNNEPQDTEKKICKCSNNAYNCGNFSTKKSAQSCYEYCLDIVGYDVHWLDDDNDGLACEYNP